MSRQLQQPTKVLLVSRSIFTVTNAPDPSSESLSGHRNKRPIRKLASKDVLKAEVVKAVVEQVLAEVDRVFRSRPVDAADPDFFDQIGVVRLHLDVHNLI